MTTSWDYTDENGNGGGYEADSPHPLQLENYDDRTLQLYSVNGEILLNFSDNYPPQFVSVQRWNVVYYTGNQYIEDSINQNESVEVVGNVIRISKDEKDYIYEVYAKWEQQGSSRYAFRVDSATETTASTEAVIRDIDDRVSWIDEGLGGYPFQGDENLVMGDFDYKDGEVYKDYYDGDDLVYRRGNEYYDKIEGIVEYYLYYDMEGHLIFAYITQYRNPSYCIYFHNDIAICLIQGERENEEETVFDEDMTHAVMLCLENAYK